MVQQRQLLGPAFPAETCVILLPLVLLFLPGLTPRDSLPDGAGPRKQTRADLERGGDLFKRGKTRRS